MYVRGGSVSRGAQRSACAPAPKRLVACPTRRGPEATVPATKAPTATRAGRASRKCTYAASRRPSPFGETVANRVLSPANAAPPSPSEMSLTNVAAPRAWASPPTTAATSAAARQSLGAIDLVRSNGLTRDLCNHDNAEPRRTEGDL